MILKKMVLAVLLYGSMAGVAVVASAGTFQDPLDLPARQLENAAAEPLQAIARAGSRFVAVGMRGVVIVSDDDGESWRQIEVPVSTDLLAVQFIDAERGWIAGDSGVILQTMDGGETWAKKMDGRLLHRQLIDQYQKQVDRGNTEAEGYLQEMQVNFEAGPEPPMLGVWFEDESNGFAVSTFGMLLATRDGGVTWESWMERVDETRGLHYYSIKGIAGDVYVTAEQGMVFRLDREQQRFVALSTGYQGGLFGIVGNEAALIAFGLQGNAFISQDRGESWEALHRPLGAGINAGLITDDGLLTMATQDGRVVTGSPRTDTQLNAMELNRSMLFTGLAASPTSLVITGFGGVQAVALSQ